MRRYGYTMKLGPYHTTPNITERKSELRELVDLIEELFKITAMATPMDAVSRSNFTRKLNDIKTRIS